MKTKRSRKHTIIGSVVGTLLGGAVGLGIGGGIGYAVDRKRTKKNKLNKGSAKNLWLK